MIITFLSLRLQFFKTFHCDFNVTLHLIVTSIVITITSLLFHIVFGKKFVELGPI